MTEKTASVEDIREPIKGQFANSIWYIIVGGIVIALLAVPFLILCIGLTNTYVPDATDAKQIKDLIFSYAKIPLTAILGGGPLALMARSLIVTRGKIKQQSRQNCGASELLQSGVTFADTASTPRVLDDFTAGSRSVQAFEFAEDSQ